MENLSSRRVRETDRDYYGIIAFVTEKFVKEYGETKYQKIQERVMISNKISGLISLSMYKKLPPGSLDFVYCINEVRQFIFSNMETKTLACLLTLERWNQEVNKKLYLMDENDLYDRAIGIVRKTKVYYLDI